MNNSQIIVLETLNRLNLSIDSNACHQVWHKGKWQPTYVTVGFGSWRSRKLEYPSAT